VNSNESPYSLKDETARRLSLVYDIAAECRRLIENTGFYKNEEDVLDEYQTEVIEAFKATNRLKSVIQQHLLYMPTAVEEAADSLKNHVGIYSDETRGLLTPETFEPLLKENKATVEAILSSLKAAFKPLLP
jgi:hypothetical protein